MNIFTYFVPISTIDSASQYRLLQQWCESWTRFGWFPQVISEAQARLHPKWSSYHEVMQKKPLMNSSEYELACFYRWLATAQVGGGFQADYDCLNNGLRPEEVASMAEDGQMTIYEPDHVPSLVSGSRSEFERMVDLFSGFEVGQYKDWLKIHSNGGTAMSDMLVLANNPEKFRKYKLVWEFNREPGWEKAKAIHFSAGACGGLGKEAAISQWLKIRK